MAGHEDASVPVGQSTPLETNIPHGALIILQRRGKKSSSQNSHHDGCHLDLDLVMMSKVCEDLHLWCK